MSALYVLLVTLALGDVQVEQRTVTRMWDIMNSKYVNIKVYGWLVCTKYDLEFIMIIIIIGICCYTKQRIWISRCDSCCILEK